MLIGDEVWNKYKIFTFPHPLHMVRGDGGLKQGMQFYFLDEDQQYEDLHLIIKDDNFYFCWFFGRFIIFQWESTY